ncbi:MAG: lipopolysaccharide biosynthesis protein [Sphingobacteriales bacterium]|nr:MAG: lipopolysaccharide biosynthesis protein [Sphingobacteriales bacterium]
MKRRARLIAFYLPQYHPVPDNDSFWGKGFTEWTNVTKAKPLFEGHKQPKLPADLGYYDLRVKEVREEQALLAKEAGIEAFCYWHYWFGNGKRILERVFDEVLESGKPEFPFCLGWANESWTGKWHGLDKEVIVEQSYPGEEDYKNHFYSILPALKDKRYLTVNGKLLFLIYNPLSLPDPLFFTNYWNALARENNLNEFYFIGVADHWTPAKSGFNKRIRSALASGVSLMKKPILQRILKTKTPELLYEYKELVQQRIKEGVEADELHCIIPNWDNTPRSGYRGRIFMGESPLQYQQWLQSAVEQVSGIDFEERIIFIKSWNEWAEGNFLEPSMEWGHQYLDATKSAVLY